MLCLLELPVIQCTALNMLLSEEYCAYTTYVLKTVTSKTESQLRQGSQSMGHFRITFGVFFKANPGAGLLESMVSANYRNQDVSIIVNIG